MDESESDPVEVQVNLLKKQLVLAQQACFLSLIQLEKDRNPHGTNDNHRYEDLREEIAKSGQQSITKFKNELAMRLAPFNQCNCPDTRWYTVTTNPQAQTINIKHKVFRMGNQA